MDNQPINPHAAGAGQSDECAALPSTDPLVDDVPIPGGKDESALSDARWGGQRRTEGY